MYSSIPRKQIFYLLKNALKSTSDLNKNGASRSITIYTRLNSSNIYNIQDEADFKKRVLENTKPVIVDFHAIWCGPCKILGPRLEKIMAEYKGTAEMAKCDIDQLTDLAFEYKVNSVPTVIAFKNGKEAGKFIGLLDDDRLKKFLKEQIGK